MAKHGRLPFHIQHNTTPTVVAKTLKSAIDGSLSLESLSTALGYGKGTIEKVMLPWLRQMGVLDGWKLSEFGERLRQLVQTHHELLPEAVHVHLYTLHWVQPEAYFSFAYSAICDWLWERGEWLVDGKTKSQLVGVVVETAGQVYGVDSGQIAFSNNSIQGALNWLKELNPPVLQSSGKSPIFKRRSSCSVYTLLWAVSALYQHPKWKRDYGVRMQLDDERLELLCKICLTNLDGLEKVLEMAERIYDYRRPNGFFGLGTEGGFGRWLILTKPLPIGSM